MRSDDYAGKRVRLLGDAPYSRRVADYLTDEQESEGPEGEIVRSAEEGGEVYYFVRLDNVPGEVRFRARDCRIIVGA